MAIKEIGDDGYDPETGEVIPENDEIAALRAKLAALTSGKAGAATHRESENPAPEDEDEDGGVIDAEADAEVAASVSDLTAAVAAAVAKAGRKLTASTVVADGRASAEDQVFDREGNDYIVEAVMRGILVVSTEDGKVLSLPSASLALSEGFWDTEATPEPEAARPSLSQRAAVGNGTGGAVARVRGSEVAVNADMAALFEGDAGRGINFAARDLIIPRLALLQDNSPQVKEGTMGHLPGARPGLLLNSVTQDMVSRAHFIPCFYTRRFVAWKKRDEKGGGGGLVNPEVQEREYLSYEPDGIGKRIYRDEKLGIVEVVDTPEWSGLISFDDGSTWGPIAIDMAGTKAKVAGKANSVMTMQVMRRKDGSEFTPPCYANAFEISSKREGEGSESYFVYTMELSGRVGDPVLYARARKLNEQFEAGEVEIVPQAQSAV